MNQLIFDNPILIKHIRTRLRPPQSIYTGIVTLILCLCLMWFGWEAKLLDNGGIFTVM